MKNLKIIRGIAFCLTVFLLMSITILAVPFKVSANDTTSAPDATGSCGDNAYWEYYEDTKTLKILGSGDMYEYGSAPWSSYMNTVKKIIVGNDITRITKGAFRNPNNTLEELTVPFIGESKNAVGPNAVLGYIFGYNTIGFTYFYFDWSEGDYDSYRGDLTVYTTNDSYHNSTSAPNKWEISEVNMRMVMAFIAEPLSSYQVWGDSYEKCEEEMGQYYYSSPDYSFKNFKVAETHGIIGLPPEVIAPVRNYTTWQYTSATSALRYSGYSFESYYYNIPIGLKTVNITNSNVIPTAAFNGCYFIEEINTSLPIETVGEYAFQGCGFKPIYALETHTFFNGVDTYRYVVKDRGAIIVGCETTNTAIAIPKVIDGYKITGIHDNAFADMVNIKSVTIPTTVTYIGKSAFYCCTSLTDVYYDAPREEWEKIDIGENNTWLLDATIHFPVIPVSGITLNKTAVEMWSGDVEELKATISPANASEQGISWVSLDPMVATVDNGIVRAIGKGKTTIIATTKDGNKTAECAVTVHRGASVEEFKIWETNYNSEGLTQEELYNRSHTLGVSWSPIVYRYSDTEDYDVYSMVLFNIVSEDNKSYLYTCKPSKVSGGYIAQNLSYTLPAGKAYTVTATLRVGYDKNGYFVEKESYTSNTITIDLPECSYYNTAFEAQYLAEQATCGSPAKYYANCEHCGVNYEKIVPHGEVDPNNHVYGKWASIDADNHRRSCECASKSETEPHTYENRVCVDCGVEDSRIYVNEVSLNKASVELNIGESEALIATVDPADATNKAVTWTSSDPSVATVSNGTVTAISAGTTTITATTVDGSKTATCIVTVNEEPIVDAGVIYTISSASGKPGSIVEVALTVSSDVAVNGLLLDNLEYDGNALEFVEFAEYGDLITTSALGANGVDSAEGAISLGYTDALMPNGEICIIKFRVKDTAEDGEYTISIDGAASVNGQKLPSKVNSGKITISKWVSGDFDSNEKLDMKDVVYFMNWINFSWTGKYPMVYDGDKDFNKDGNVDMKDVVYFMNWVNFSWTGNYDINW